MMGSPIIFSWDGESMVPLDRFRHLCDDTYVIGERYRMDVNEERSINSHNHYFAALHDAWLNLPDHIALRFTTAEALRKHALIMTGHRDERKFVASSPIEARKLAAFIRPADEYAIISVAGNVVVEWKAKSQSRKAMGAPTFQRSKQDVLDFVASLIGVEPAALAAQAGKAA